MAGRYTGGDAVLLMTHASMCRQSFFVTRCELWGGSLPLNDRQHAERNLAKQRGWLKSSG